MLDVRILRSLVIRDVDTARVAVIDERHGWDITSLSSTQWTSDWLLHAAVDKHGFAWLIEPARDAKGFVCRSDELPMAIEFLSQPSILRTLPAHTVRELRGQWNTYKRRHETQKISAPERVSLTSDQVGSRPDLTVLNEKPVTRELRDKFPKGLSRATLEEELKRVDEAIVKLQRRGGKTSAGSSIRRGRRRLSAADRKRMAEAQRARWAKVKGQKSKHRSGGG